MSFTCFTDRVLTDTLTTLEFVFTQRPRQRANRTPELRIAFFLRPLFTTALKMLMCSIDAFDRGYLHILGVIGIVRSRRAEVLEMVNLVIHRHRNTPILPHLRTHLEHVVLQLLLVAQLRIKPLFLCFRRLRTELKGYFHSAITHHTFNPYRVGRQTRNLAVTLYMSASVIHILNHNLIRMSSVFSKKTLWSNPRGRIFLPH